jgi:hypothetical protein
VCVHCLLGGSRGLCGRTGAAKGTSLNNGAEEPPQCFCGRERHGSCWRFRISAPPKRVTPTEHRREHGKERRVCLAATAANQLDAGATGISVKGFLILALSWLSDVAVKCVNPSRAVRLQENGGCEGEVAGVNCGGEARWVLSSRLSRGKK